MLLVLAGLAIGVAVYLQSSPAPPIQTWLNKPANLDQHTGADPSVATATVAADSSKQSTTESPTDLPTYPQFAAIGKWQPAHSSVQTPLHPYSANSAESTGIADGRLQGPVAQAVYESSATANSAGPIALATYQAPQEGYAVYPQDPAGSYPPLNGYGATGGYGSAGANDPPARMMLGVDGNTCRTITEPRWRDVRPIPFESFSYGEYIGPHRTPHVEEYRIRVRDQLEFVYILTRETSNRIYRLGVGDVIAITSTQEETLRQPTVPILPDGSISLPQIGRLIAAGKSLDQLSTEINDRYREAGVRFPEVVVQGVQVNTRLQDLRDAVDARAGIGGTSRQAEVAPDGTVQLPLIHSVPAVGLTLRELGREINARYSDYVEGIEITPILVQLAPRSAFVLGEVAQPGRVALEGPTTAMQTIALAGGWNPGGNLRQIIIFRRDANWNLMATKLDLAGAVHGRRPFPSDEVFIRDGDIILVPKQPIQRLADAIDLYVTRTIYAVFPNQGFNLNFNSGSEL